MSLSRAPGKLVLSGAYAVLHGATAIVSAVDRYVTADTSRPAELVTPEVQAALAPGEAAPWFDAAPLREAGRKLGLGSSAAILVASLHALEQAARPELDAAALRGRVFERALAAHRAAQGGGSGVDVASSSFGGTLAYRLAEVGPELRAVALPPDWVLEVWTCPVSSSTPALLAAVAQLEASQHRRLLGEQAAQAERAAEALASADRGAFILALRAQHRALAALGRAAGVPIVTPELAELEPAAEAEGGVLLPAGAGGGDLAIFAGRVASSPGLRQSLAARAHRILPVVLSAAGAGSL